MPSTTYITQETLTRIRENQRKYEFEPSEYPFLNSSPPVFLTLYLTQSLIVEPKVVGYFMAHHFLYSCPNFIAKAAILLNGLLKDAYLIR